MQSHIFIQSLPSRGETKIFHIAKGITTHGLVWRSSDLTIYSQGERGPSPHYIRFSNGFPSALLTHKWYTSEMFKSSLFAQEHKIFATRIIVGAPIL